MAKKNVATYRQSEAGFTLVELAVVLIIVGLLVGGILKGQELIQNAQLKTTISQIEGIRAAVQTFQDKYGAFPGDISNPQTRLPNCTAAPCNEGGDANGRIDEAAINAAPAKGNENINAMVHLSNAGLLSGLDPTDDDPVFGQNLPAAKVGGGFWISHKSGSTNPTGLSMRNGHYLVLNGSVAAPGGTNGALTPAQAAQIDRALDDGKPTSGSIYGVGTGCTPSGSADEYNEGNSEGACTLLIGL